MRVLRNSWTEEWEASGREVQRFPMQAVAAMQEGVFHLGGDESTVGVDPERECYPAGQGGGGINALEPAGDRVRRSGEEAGAVLAGPAPARVGPRWPTRRSPRRSNRAGGRPSPRSCRRRRI